MSLALYHPLERLVGFFVVPDSQPNLIHLPIPSHDVIPSWPGGLRNQLFRKASNINTLFVYVDYINNE